MSEFKDTFRHLLQLSAGITRDSWDLRPHEIELREQILAAPKKLAELLAAHEGQRLDLRGVSLSGLNLAGMDLSNADLTGACLEFGDLCGTDLSGADLTDANLNDTRFDDETRWPPGFDFRTCGALGPGAILRGASPTSPEDFPRRLPCTDLTGAHLVAIEVYGGDLRSTRFCEATVTGATFHDTDLRFADFREADLRGTVFSSCDLRGADFRGAKNLRRVTFDCCKFDEHTLWDDDDDRDDDDDA